MSSLFKLFPYFVVAVLTVAGMSLINSAVGPACNNKQAALPDPAAVANIEKHDITPKAPVKAYDKKALREKGFITRAVERSEKAEVVATGRISDASGTRTLSAVLDTETGTSSIVEKRPLAEWMHSHEVSIGYGIVNGELAKAAKYDFTFGRIGPVYASFSGEVTQTALDTDWQIMTWLTWRF